MARFALLKFTIQEFGLYRLDVVSEPELGAGALNETERMTALALCDAVNQGLVDEAVFQALNAQVDALEAASRPALALAVGE
ncbi:MAG: hypothetical protein EBZ50_05390 [Alphaproteobacteria bacterium]|nr:hypothetical protein [Alphaproteobacteria bacterium]